MESSIEQPDMVISGEQLIVTSRDVPTQAQQPPTPSDLTSITVKLPPTPAEPAAEPPPLSSNPPLTYPEITPIPRAPFPPTRPRAGSTGRSEPTRRRHPILPTRPQIDFPEFHKHAPREALERAISKIDNISHDELKPIELAKLKALLGCAIHQDSLTNRINTSSIGDLQVMLNQLERGIDRFMQRGPTGGSQPSSVTSSHASSQDESGLPDSPTPPPQGRPRKRRRIFRASLRAELLRRESQRCAISHNADKDMLIAAHILPFSVQPPDDPCWGMLRLFLGPNLDLLRDRYINDGIDCLDNAWMLSNTLDICFTKARCYLEPVTEPESTLDAALSADPADSSDTAPSHAGQASYTFHWLDEPDEPCHYGKNHPTRQGKYIKTGDIITLCTVDTVTLPLPNRYLLMIQAAVYKLNKEFRALADVFPDTHSSDDEESVSCFNKDGCEGDYWDQGYQEDYWSRVQSWLDQYPGECAPVEDFLPSSCSPVGIGFDKRFSSSIEVPTP